MRLLRSRAPSQHRFYSESLERDSFEKHPEIHRLPGGYYHSHEILQSFFDFFELLV
jgi:hypothetical protein